MNLKEQIERVARLEEVVERYLPLQRNGSSAKTMIGLCPFHNDRHPSLHVNVKDQYYKCFACGEGGDLFKFVQKMEGCDFRGALKKLAAWYGLSDTGSYEPAAGVPAKKTAKSISEACPEPASLLQVESLLSSHRMVLGLLETYIPEEEILREAYNLFEVRLAPAGLPASHNYLCNRLVFPIRNERGDLVAFAGRYRGETKGTKIRKYINSSNSAVYHKREILYGLYQAQEAIRRHKFVYITEGYKDVLAMYAAGFHNTVALCGTALTEQHAALLSRYTRQAIVMLDGDEAGQTKGIESAHLLSAKGFSAGRIIPEPGDDPDSMLSRMGADEFVRYVKNATRLCRLEIYETCLLKQIEQLLSALHLALTETERRQIIARMIPLHKRLGKVTEQLRHAPVLKAGWLTRS